MEDAYWTTTAMVMVGVAEGGTELTSHELSMFNKEWTMKGNSTLQLVFMSVLTLPVYSN